MKYLELLFEKFREAGIELKLSKCEFLEKEFEYLGHLKSGEGISPVKQKIKVITDLVPATNVLEDRHINGLVGYYL